MCNRPDFEAEEQALDDKLLVLFRSWQAYRDIWPDADDRLLSERIEEFLQYAHDRLPQLLAEEQSKPEQNTDGP